MKQRGRPRKQPEDGSGTKKRGRPPKKSAESGHEGSVDESPEHQEIKNSSLEKTTSPSDESYAVDEETIEVNAASTLDSAKRGRGRPRKGPMKGLGNEAGGSSTKKGRGRPRKEQITSPSDATREANGKIVHFVEVDADSNLNSAKKGRGRPPKRSMDVPDDGAEELSTDKSSDSPVKEQITSPPDEGHVLNGAVEESLEVYTASNVSSAKRGRGRPPKRAVEALGEEMGGPSTKKGRGRPRKVA